MNVCRLGWNKVVWDQSNWLRPSSLYNVLSSKSFHHWAHKCGQEADIIMRSFTEAVVLCDFWLAVIWRTTTELQLYLRILTSFFFLSFFCLHFYILSFIYLFYLFVCFIKLKQQSTVNRHELDEKIHNNTPTIDRVINTLELHVCVKTGIANK